ncbi:NADPH:quinone reductase [Planctomicrobium sp. SH668]|uniref:NADPH:quinone reductase n=1 Tax=Planctomicrobium sp. SH668 TaxID=3448126 RepID=UPI003F5C1BC7
MKCVFVAEPGPAHTLQYGDLPDPVISATQVLVKVGAASINPIDTYIRAGSIPMPVKFPYIPGCDLAGTVIEVGSDVTRFRVGDRVWGSNQGLFNRQGTLSELAAVDESWLYPTPAEMSSEQAAAGALTGITAHLGLFQFARLKPEELLFVNGGTGGVGSMVVQFAKAAGANVIVTAGSEEKRQIATSLGADVVLDYRSVGIDEEIRSAATGNGGLDVWWETQREPNITRSIGLMKKRGRIIVMAGRDAQLSFTLGPFYVNDLQLLGFAMFNASPDEQRVCAEEMNRWFTQGKWKPQIGARFPLSEAAAAHALQEENTLLKSGSLTGKIVVIPE